MSTIFCDLLQNKHNILWTFFRLGAIISLAFFERVMLYMWNTYINAGQEKNIESCSYLTIHDCIDWRKYDDEGNQEGWQSR